MQLKTVGCEYYPGYEFPVSITSDVTKLEENEAAQYYKILFLDGKHSEVILNGERLSLLGTSLICLNEQDRLEFTGSHSEEEVQILFFQPEVFNGNLTFETCNQNGGLSVTDSQDAYYFKRFRWDAQIEQKVLYLNESVLPLVRKKFKAIHELLKVQATEYWPCMSRTNILELLFCIAGLEDRKKEDYLVETDSKLATEVISYLQLHYEEKITLEELAVKFGTNRTTLNEEFKESTGKSLNKYLQQMRFQIAATLLKDTLIPIIEICQRTGFYDMSYFSKTFKKETGYTPARYRKIYNKLD